MMKENWVYRRGDIYCADLDPVVGSEQGGIRPVIVIQNDTGNRYSPTLIVATVTTKIRKKENLWTSIMIKCELMILRNYQARGMRIIPIEPMITKLQSRLCLRDWGYRIYLAETANLHQKKKNSGCCSTGYM